MLLLVTVGFSQNGSFTGMGNSSVMLYDFWAITNNQAGLSDIETAAFGVNYNHNYQLWETGVQAVGVVIPTKSGNFAIAGNRYGYSGFSENNLSLAFARNLGKYFSAALAFNYLYYKQSANYGYRGAVVVQLGMITKPIENLQIGLHVYNFARAKLQDYNDERVPTVIRFGLGYFFSEQVLVTAETEKDIDQENRFKTGIAYEPVDHFFIRTGFMTNPNQFSLGIGLKYHKLSTDIATITHETLPISGQISFKYQL
jgi:hypothetical protein